MNAFELFANRFHTFSHLPSNGHKVGSCGGEVHGHVGQPLVLGGQRVPVGLQLNHSAWKIKGIYFGL